ncbi:hypothetical protein EAG_09550 [Camponotus floridanus]|uniref:Uncharacterized protein n=1 Tax=Camponotus floridanus TaxID=104421 RepID=E1ZZB7_CAMFO|nr:hypothetical protein EAG_09550 [Camponotus floridanus]
MNGDPSSLWVSSWSLLRAPVRDEYTVRITLSGCPYATRYRTARHDMTDTTRYRCGYSITRGREDRLCTTDHRSTSRSIEGKSRGNWRPRRLIRDQAISQSPMSSPTDASTCYLLDNPTDRAALLTW